MESSNNNNNNNNTNNNNDEWNYKEEEIAHKFFFFNVLKDGRIHMFPQPFTVNQTVPPSDDPTTGVKLKDVVVSSNVSVRLFLPPGACASTAKLPVVFYVHGGAFCFCSAFSEDYTRLVTRLVDACGVIGVSVEYGLFPTRHIPACYEDCWFALTWLASHAGEKSTDSNDLGARDPWITDYADLTRIFVGGDSAGGNISHTLLSRVGKTGLPKGAKVEGMILIHPYFAENDKMWMYMCPANEGPRDPRMKPSQDDLAQLGCDRVLVLVAEKDFIKKSGVEYFEELKKSKYKGGVEFFETKDREHCFHIANYNDCEAIAINHKIKSFIHQC